MTLNGVMAVTLRYFTVFGKPAFQHITAFARKKESSRSISHLAMSFLFVLQIIFKSVQHTFNMLSKRWLFRIIPWAAKKHYVIVIGISKQVHNYKHYH